MIFIDYLPCKECCGTDVFMTCVKCGQCGRKFEKGVLLNADEYPGYDPDVDEEQ